MQSTKPPAPPHQLRRPPTSSPPPPQPPLGSGPQQQEGGQPPIGTTPHMQIQVRLFSEKQHDTSCVRTNIGVFQLSKLLLCTVHTYILLKAMLSSCIMSLVECSRNLMSCDTDCQRKRCNPAAAHLPVLFVCPGVGYRGLVNQAMTCYLNSLLQSLFMTPEFRNAIYRCDVGVGQD